MGKRDLVVCSVLFEDRVGGPHRRTLAVAKRLNESDIQTVLVIPDRGGDSSEFAKDYGVECHRISISRTPKISDYFGIVKWVLKQPKDVYNYICMFGRLRPDIVHVNGAFFIAPAVAAKLRCIPLVWHLNDTIVPLTLAKILGRINAALANQLVVAASKVSEHYGLVKFSPIVIYAPVDVVKFAQSKKARGASVIKLGLVGNWVPLKGIEYFIRAAKLVQNKLNVKVEVHLVGKKFDNHSKYSGQVEKEIDELGLRQSTFIYGFVGNVASIVKELDVLVLSSTTEACPMAVLEGMASGIPVVATDVGGVRELLMPESDNAAGIVVQSRSSEAIAAGIIDVLKSESVRGRFGKNGRKMAKERFSIERCAELHGEIYRRLRRHGRRDR